MIPARFIFFLICITHLPVFAVGFGMNLMKVPEEDRSQVVCTIALLRKYFHSGESLSGAVLSMSITSASLHIQQNLLQAIHTAADVPWAVVVKNARQDIPVVSPAPILHEKPQCYFVVVENLEDDDLEDIFEEWKTTVNWNPLAQFVVYLASVEETDEEMTELMVEILLSFMNKKIYNVNVIGQNEENGFYYGKTVFPYHPDNNCGNRVIAIETLDICNYQDVEKPPNAEDYEEEEYDGETEADELDHNMDLNNMSATPGSNEGCSNLYDNKNGCDYEGEVLGNAEDDIENYKIPYRTDNILHDKYPSVMNSQKRIQYKRNDINRELASYTYATESPNMPLSQSSNDSDGPTFYLQELYRALFLDKFPKDLSGCPLMAAYRPWEPYIFNEKSSNEQNYDEIELYDNNADVNSDSGLISNENSYADVDRDQSETESEIRLNGIEYQMVQTIGERLHISIDLQVESNNLYHLFQQLIDGDIEMVIGGIDEDPSISQFVSSTIPYHQDDLTWCVAKAQRKYNLFNVLGIFHWSTWVLTSVFTIAVSINILLTQRLLRIRIPNFHGYFTIVLRILGIILSQSTQLSHIPLTLKLSFGSAFFMSFMFINTYQSFLVSTLTTPKSSYQISRLDEIYQHRMTVTGSVENVRHLNKDGEVFQYIRETFQMCYNIEDCLNSAASNEHVAVAVSRQHSFYNPRILRNQLYCFDRDENLYVYLVTMLLPKKFHLLHKINPVIQHIIESGHIQKWARDLDLKRKIQEEIYRAREEPVKSLTLNQVGGSFALDVILLSAAFSILLLERWVYWMTVKQGTRCKLIKMLHRRFC